MTHKATRRLPLLPNCPYVDGHVCVLSHGQHCPSGCKLPRRCETCGNASCVFFDSYDGIEGIAYCWIPPFWYDKYEDEGDEE